jgi:formylglycine-generating enzyme required for sulfatase activity
MKTNLLNNTLLALFALSSVTHATISIDTVTVGDIGNPNDSTGYGAVSYAYAIGKTEVTLLEYTAFLNAVAATDTYSLYNTNMATDLNIAGISRAGGSGSYTYSIIGDGNRPVTYVSWFDAARFANWMHNGQPTGAQGAGTTEQGAYTLNGATSGVGYTKNAGATWWIPSENEWYKAAYYQPAAQGGDTDGYWLYPTRSNTQPNSRNGSASDSNSANCYYDDSIANGYNGGYAVTNSTSYSASQNYLTTVGAFTVADSYYGTFDQGGNVWEWNDAVIGSSRGLRGGSWTGVVDGLQASFRASNSPQSEASFGFRLSTVPEPSALATLLGGAAVLGLRRRRR